MNFLLHPFPQCFHSYETENKTGLCNTQHHPTVHALLSWHVQILQMETCACLINYKECTLRIPLQNLSAEKYAIKKPQGMWAVCSPCPTSVPTLQFQGKSQTICADLFELESWRGGRVISKGKGSVKMGRKGGGKTVFFGETVFEPQSSCTVLYSHCHSWWLKWNLDVCSNEPEHIHALL